MQNFSCSFLTGATALAGFYQERMKIETRGQH